MGKPERCFGEYRATWDTVERCAQTKRHTGPHGPAPAPQVPAIVVRKPALAVEGSETSKAAARRIEPVRGTLRERVYEALRTPGGLTDEEGCERLGMNPSTYRPRRIELFEANRIVKTPLTRATKSGRSAAVYRAFM